MKLFRRRQFFVDYQVQGALIFRSMMCWGFCLLSITVMMICWRIALAPSEQFYTHFTDVFQQFLPALVASVLMMPVILWDMVKMSNRFVGPVYRLRRSMKQLASGEPTRSVHFRQGDFWQDFAEDFNIVAARLHPEDETSEEFGEKEITEEETAETSEAFEEPALS